MGTSYFQEAYELVGDIAKIQRTKTQFLSYSMSTGTIVRKKKYHIVENGFSHYGQDRSKDWSMMGLLINNPIFLEINCTVEIVCNYLFRVGGGVGGCSSRQIYPLHPTFFILYFANLFCTSTPHMATNYQHSYSCFVLKYLIWLKIDRTHLLRTYQLWYKGGVDVHAHYLP